MKDKRVLLGSFGVDSGQVLICDPCYIDSEWEKSNERKIGKFSYGGCCATTLGANEGEKPKDGIAFGGELLYKKGHSGAGVVSCTGFGDGCYEVFAVIGDVPHWGKRVKKLEIIFVD